MALLPILHYPDPRLNRVAARGERVDDKIRKLINDMADAMYTAPGVGLAATQVDVHLRIIVIDISESRGQLQVFVNPELIAASGVAEREDGCLSVPDVYEKVRRAERVTVRARRMPKAGCTRWRLRGCLRCVSSMKWITSTARYSSKSCRA